MEQTSELKLSPQRLKHFLVHLALTQKKISRKRETKAAITESIERIKELSKGAKKSEIIEELEKLEKKVSELAEMQIKVRAENELMLRKLQEKLGTIKPLPEAKPFEDFEKISVQLSENVARLAKIGEAEKKVEEEVGEEKTEIEKIEERLKLLEERFNKLKSSKKAKKSDIERIKKLIEAHKKTIKDIKSKFK